MLMWALRYLRMGLSIIPIEPKGKRPLIPWAEYQKRRATEEEAKEWLKKWPDMNLGVVTGAISGLVIVDLDGPEGLVTAQDLKITSLVRSITGNGEHLWYRHTGKEVENSVRKFPGVDIRGDGGYVIVAPSVHESGKRYRWVGIAPNVKPNTDFPAVLSGTDVSLKNGIQKSPDWISQALEGMKIGNIDSTLVSILGRMRRDGYSSNDALSLLYPHAIKAGAEEGHLEEKIKNVWGRYEPVLRAIGQNPSDEFCTDKTESLAEFLQEEEPIKWIVPGMIAQGSLVFFVGLPETGKTWAAMDLAIKVSNGELWLDQYRCAAPSKVLFVDQERFRGETKRRFNSLLDGKRPSLLSIRCGTSTRIDLEHSFSAFRNSLTELKPDLVIVDSLATFHTKEENNRMEIQSVLEKVKQLRNEFGCTFVFIHHENKMAFASKEEGKEPSIAEMAGNIAIPAAAELVYTFRKRSNGDSLVYNTKNTLGKTVPMFEIKIEDIGPGKVSIRGIV